MKPVLNGESWKAVPIAAIWIGVGLVGLGDNLGSVAIVAVFAAAATLFVALL